MAATMTRHGSQRSRIHIQIRTPNLRPIRMQIDRLVRSLPGGFDGRQGWIRPKRPHERRAGNLRCARPQRQCARPVSSCDLPAPRELAVGKPACPNRLSGPWDKGDPVTWSAAERHALGRVLAGSSSRCRRIAPREDAAWDHRKLGLEPQALQEESPAGARGLSSPSANLKSEMSEGLCDMRPGRAPDTPVAAHRRESAGRHQAWPAGHRSG